MPVVKSTPAGMVAVQSTSDTIHPLISTKLGPALYNSIHSPLLGEAPLGVIPSVPHVPVPGRGTNSLIKTRPEAVVVGGVVPTAVPPVPNEIPEA